MSDPLTSLDAMIKRIDPGHRMVDGSIVKAVLEKMGRAKEAAMIEHGPRLIDEGLLHDMAVFLSSAALTNVFQERGERLVDGAAVKALASLPTSVPVNIDAPHVSGSPAVEGNVLHCTMGNWTGEPTSYFYWWESNGAHVGINSPDHTITATEVGTAMRCRVTTTNGMGNSNPVYSNTV